MKTHIVLLTGGSSGIGLEIAKQLMEKGIKVYSASRRLASPQKSIYGEGEIIPVKMDVNNENEIVSVVDHIVKDNNRLDAIICNAGNGIAGSVEDTSVEEAKYQFETNFFGVVKTIQTCLPVFRNQGFGKIMVTSSFSAITPIPYQAFYSAAKSALFNFIQALSIEVKQFGIQCCTVLPGNTCTEFTSHRQCTHTSQCNESAYTTRMNHSLKRMEEDENNGMKASFVARRMVKEIRKNKMREIVIPGISYRLVYNLYPLMPVKFRLWMISKLY